MHPLKIKRIYGHSITHENTCTHAIRESAKRQVQKVAERDRERYRSREREGKRKRQEKGGGIQEEQEIQRK